MNIPKILVREASRVVGAVTAVAGAAGGAVTNGVIGGVRGGVEGVRDGVRLGSHSTPAAVLTLGVLGAAGVIEWPLVLGVGGAALVLRQLRSDDQPATATLAPVPSADTSTTGTKKASTAKPTMSAATTGAASTTGTRPRQTAARTRRAPSKRS